MFVELVCMRFTAYQFELIVLLEYRYMFLSVCSIRVFKNYYNT